MITPPFIAALEFASLPMLGWLAAALLPWLIHRLQRRQHETTRWAAVELLLTAMQQRGRTVQFQQWLLLAVRTAILLFVALAAAEPALRQWAVGAGGSTQVHRILVVDQSYSMGAESEEVSRWQHALTHARQQIERSSGDALTVIGWAAQAENLVGRPTFDTSVALAALEDLQLSQASVELRTAAHAILAAIERAKVEFPQIVAHQVIFFTDLGRRTWQTDANEQHLIEQVAEQAQVTVVNVADNRHDNLAVTNLTIKPALTLQQREAAITATLSSFDVPGESNLRVELLIDGRSVGQQSVELSRSDETSARFTHRFIEKGAHTVQAKLVNSNDALPVDDTRWLIVDVRPRLRVACFAGSAGAADDLARALAPGRVSGGPAAEIKPEIFSVSRLGEIKLSDYAALLLCNIPELSSRESAAVTEYVRQGGGLALFLGPQTTPEGLSGLEEMLPVRVGQPQPVGQYRFDPGEYRHPIVSPFRGQSQSGLLGVTVSQYCELKFLEERQSPEIVLALDTGDPALVVDRFGLGRVVVSALPGSLAARTSLGTPWSSFAISPSFLPVVRELVTYLVGDRWLQQRNLAVGQAAIFPWDTAKAYQSASVRLPAGVSRKLALPGAEDRGQLMFRETDASGVYRFSADEQECARFAVNLDGRDSDLMPIALDELPAGFATNAVEGSAVLPLATSDFSFVRLLLAGALLLLLVEIGLAYLLGRGWG